LRLNEKLKECNQTGNYAVLACSALKHVYRELLAQDVGDCCVVYLKGDYDTIYERMNSREGHYMGARMLQSQFDALEEPTDALTLSIVDEPEEIASKIEAHLEKVKNEL